MCGIAGFVARPGRAAAPDWLSLASTLLAHRGPDAVGFLQWTPGSPPRKGREPNGEPALVGFAHRRLAILDLSDAGWQPMTSPDGRYHVVYNGEVYNYVELRQKLESSGRRFRSTGDTEVILAAFQEWDVEALSRMVGMFAFAILDAERQRLVIARDPFGIKPLFFADTHEGLGFSSEIGPLLQLSGVSRAADAEAAYDYLRHAVTDHDDRSMFRDVRRLPAGHLLELDLTAPRFAEPREYWSVRPGSSIELSRDGAARRLRELFLESVDLHLRSDVVVGTALSGGIDSSAIVMAMRALRGPDLDIRTFSWIADEPGIDESRWVDLVVDAAGAEAMKVRAGPEDLVEDLDRLIDVQAEPFRSTSIYAQYRVFRLAAEAGVKVMLDGQGADELLGGYWGHAAARAAGLLRGGHVVRATQLLRRASRLPDRPGLPPLAARTIARILPSWADAPARRLAGEDLVPSWLNGAWFEARGVSGRTAREGGAAREGLRGTLTEDLRRTSLPALLRYEDRNSMAWSVESRVPFLTPALAEFVLALPEEYLVDDEGTTKAVFRTAMQGLVPDPVLERRDKIGFATPERSWLTGLSSWVEDVLARARTQPGLPIRIDALDPKGSQLSDGVLWRAVNLA
ncbi:MAG: asparagine synthase (glutamine-hydrolyzing), partial [Acidimicrobiia bacterium]|nr:asparagine synthase (glutamine-hydrolyzing) [Acidimicrobiia bacterium]